MAYFWENPVFQIHGQSPPRASYVENRVKVSKHEGPWTDQYQNQMPDSHFLIVKPGCATSKSGGRSTPKRCRALPYKNKAGALSCSHLKNAEARANQVEGVSAAARRRAKKKASDLYDMHCAEE